MGDFGEVRSLVHHSEPSKEVFARLVRAFKGARDQGEAERVWLPYALEHLGRWRDEDREIKLMSEGDEDTFWFEIARALAVKSSRWSPDALRSLLTSERLAGVVSLDVEQGAPGEVMGWIAGSEHVGALRSLRLGRTKGGRVSMLGLEATSTLRLGSLDLSGCRLLNHGLKLLARSPALAGLHTLNVSRCGIGGEGMRAWARTSHLKGVRSLDLSMNALLKGELDLWASAEGHAAFERLNLGYDPLGDTGLASLVEAGRLDGCRSLELAWCNLSDAGVAALFRDADLELLTTLELNGNAFGPSASDALSGASLPALETLGVGHEGPASALYALRSAGMPTLSTFTSSSSSESSLELPEDRSEEQEGPLVVSMHNCRLGAEAVRALVETRRVWGATALHMSFNPIGVEGARALGACENLRSLTSLDLEMCDLGDEGLEALFPECADGRFAALERLELMSNDLTDGSSGTLPRSGIVGLKSLVVELNPVGAAWVGALVASPVSASLEVLNVNSTEIGDEGLGHIGASPHLGALRELSCGSVGASCEGARALVGGDAMRGLTTLGVRGAALTSAFALALASSPSAEALEKLSLDLPSWDVEAWRAVATSPHLRALRRVDWLQAGRPPFMDEALELARREGDTLNPWAKAYVHA